MTYKKTSSENQQNAYEKWFCIQNLAKKMANIGKAKHDLKTEYGMP